MNIAVKLLLTTAVWLVLVIVSLLLVWIARREYIRVVYNDDLDKLIDLILYMIGGRGILLHGVLALFVAAQYWKAW